MRINLFYRVIISALCFGLSGAVICCGASASDAGIAADLPTVRPTTLGRMHDAAMSSDWPRRELATLTDQSGPRLSGSPGLIAPATQIANTISGLSQTQGTATGPKTAPPLNTSQHDGQHDFDFDIGTWNVHISLLKHPLTDSTQWVEFNGNIAVRKVWDGRANFAETHADGAAGHLELLSLRLYDPQAHQWSLNFSGSDRGTLSTPMIGEFNNGRGEFIDQESYNGRKILVRFVIWSDTPNSGRSEQAFSDDGGKTWQVNMTNTYTRIG